MAMLSWIKLNPTVKVINTKKKFFDSYLYKAVVYAPGCRIILNKKDSDARSMLEKRIQILTETKSYNYGGSWFRSTSAEKLQKEGKWDQLQFFIDNKENVCPISLEPLVKGATYVLPCGHMVSKDGFEPLKTSSTFFSVACPVCRHNCMHYNIKLY